MKIRDVYDALQSWSEQYRNTPKAEWSSRDGKVVHFDLWLLKIVRLVKRFCSLWSKSSQIEELQLGCSMLIQHLKRNSAD